MYKKYTRRYKVKAKNRPRRSRRTLKKGGKKL